MQPVALFDQRFRRLSGLVHAEFAAAGISFEPPPLRRVLDFPRENQFRCPGFNFRWEPGLHRIANGEIDKDRSIMDHDLHSTAGAAPFLISESLLPRSPAARDSERFPSAKPRITRCSKRSGFSQ